MGTNNQKMLRIKSEKDIIYSNFQMIPLIIKFLLLWTVPIRKFRKLLQNICWIKFYPNFSQHSPSFNLTMHRALTALCIQQQMQAFTLFIPTLGASFCSYSLFSFFSFLKGTQWSKIQGFMVGLNGMTIFSTNAFCVPLIYGIREKKEFKVWYCWKRLKL